MQETILTTAGDDRISVMKQNGQAPVAQLVLAHGAGAPMTHEHMNRLSEMMLQLGVAVTRFNFPYMERGGGRVDSVAQCNAAFEAVTNWTRAADPALPVILGGHSFGGRMASHYAVEAHPGIVGLIYFSFPLHPSGKPSVDRAAHLGRIQAPQLFVSGDRDKLAETHLLVPTAAGLDKATLCLLETADHGFRILKRTRTNPDSVYLEAKNAIAHWLSTVI